MSTALGLVGHFPSLIFTHILENTIRNLKLPSQKQEHNRREVMGAIAEAKCRGSQPVGGDPLGGHLALLEVACDSTNLISSITFFMLLHLCMSV